MLVIKLVMLVILLVVDGYWNNVLKMLWFSVLVVLLMIMLKLNCFVCVVIMLIVCVCMLLVMKNVFVLDLVICFVRFIVFVVVVDLLSNDVFVKLRFVRFRVIVWKFNNDFK